MKVTLELPHYSPETGIRTQWEEGFTIATSGTVDCFVLKANKAGLVSLATHLLTLAQEEVPAGCHNSLR
ncbi:Imm32 family immunity protein [Hymenobacter ginsengisoli]|uniref:Imm32 family immunity protein n=1 Tax=Hymenobacter ginsengisoli TaxID=1051626 RepID=UPI003CD079C2